MEMTAPPPITVPEPSKSTTCCRWPGCISESASRKIRYLPSEARAPAFRARAICRRASEMIFAPASSASLPVLSVEALSTTMTSTLPSETRGKLLRNTERIANAINRSSLYAGMMTETKIVGCWSVERGSSTFFDSFTFYVPRPTSHHARLMYCPVRVSTFSDSPSLIKSGT